MVAVYGDVQAQDDYTHPLGPETNFNESMYFNFFDHSRRQGGFVRIGNRANEGYAEVTLTLYLPTGEVLFNYLRPQIDSNDAMDAGGMKFEILEPLLKHRSTFEGGAVFLTNPSQMADPSNAFRNNPKKRVTVDITHEGVGPVYGSAGSQPDADSEERSFARAHYEQHMRTYGTITVDGETLQIDGTGLRDHSWGPRYWQAIHSYRWLTCTFGPDLGIMVSEITREEDGPRAQNGVVIRGEGFDRIVKVDLDSEFSEGERHHKRMTARIGTQSGEELVIEGHVLGYIPLRNRRANMITHIGEGMTEYKMGDRTALGISEYLDQVQ